MKIIKFLLASFFLLACNHLPAKAQDQIKTAIGKLENGAPVLTVDKPKMLAAYNENLLKLSAIDGRFTDVAIKAASDKNYFLVFKGSTYTSSFRVMEDHLTLFVVPTTSCTTSDCSSEEFGCTPTVSGGACRACSNKGKCTKTVTDRSMLE
ncbi:MAG: hypothetical protein JST02_05435 [Bacteroidetes bacterium]|nr:hypothetical protein [Bacteroidota bacterium]